MKTVYLLRHAKSSWRDTARDDHDRPLNSRGLEAARAIGHHLRRAQIEPPQCVLCSTAIRARQTWRELDVIPVVSVEMRADLYMASAGKIHTIIRALENRFTHVMLIGHNPGLAQAAQRLTGAGDQGLRQSLAEKYPTGALAELRFNIDAWRDASWQGATLMRFIRPRQLADRG